MRSLLSDLFFFISNILVSFSMGSIIDPVLAENNMVDLFVLSDSSFSKLASEWKINGSVSAQPSKCGTLGAIVGGFEVLRCGEYLERLYKPLPSHQIITYSFVIIVMDQWQTGNKLEIKFDDKIAFSFEPSKVLAAKPWLTSECGGSQPENYLSLVGRIFHSSSTLNLTLSSYPINSQAYFGIREIRMIFKDAKPIDTEQSCLSHASNLPYGCKCTSGNYFDSETLACKPCSPACTSCNGPTEKNCDTCPYKSGYTTNTETCETCPSNCFLCYGSKCYVCYLPYISNYNYDCIHTNLCKAPYIKDDTVCRTPCEANTTFMLWNNTCSSSRDFPLIPRTAGRAKFCDLPCNNNTLSYSYWNGSCLLNCPFYQRNEGGYKYCDACQPGYFLFPNKTCLPDCPKPFKVSIEGWSKFCNYPCASQIEYYFTKDSKCRKDCKYPFKIVENVFCVLEISAEEAAQVEKAAEALSSSRTATQSAGSSISLINFSNPAAIFIQAFMDMFGYVKYLNIKYPPKLEYSFALKVDPPFKIIPEFPEELLKQIPKQPLPEQFEKDEDLHSSFLVNFWSSLVLLSFIGFTVFLFICLEKCVKNSRSIKSFIRNANSIMRWNFTLTLFTSYFGQIVFYTALELQTANPNTPLKILSFIICFATNLLVFIVFSQIVKVIMVHWLSIRKQKANMMSFVMKRRLQDLMSSYEVVFQNLKEQSLIQQSFTLFFVARVYIYMIVIAYLFEYPFLQTILIVIINFGMLFYLLFTRPLQSKLDLIQYALQETIMLITNTCVLTLSLFDYMNVDDISSRETLGDIIMNSNIGFSGIGSVYLLIQVFFQLRAGIRFLRRVYQKFKNPRRVDSIPVRETSNIDMSQSISLTSSKQVPDQGSDHFEQDLSVAGNISTNVLDKNTTLFTSEIIQENEKTIPRSHLLKAKLDYLIKYNRKKKDIN